MVFFFFFVLLRCVEALPQVSFFLPFLIKRATLKNQLILVGSLLCCVLPATTTACFIEDSEAPISGPARLYGLRRRRRGKHDTGRPPKAQSATSCSLVATPCYLRWLLVEGPSPIAFYWPHDVFVVVVWCALLLCWWCVVDATMVACAAWNSYYFVNEPTKSAVAKKAGETSLVGHL